MTEMPHIKEEKDPFILLEPQTTADSSIIWLHGLGASGDDFVPIAPVLDLPNTRFIFPHAPVRPITLNMGLPMRGWYDIYNLDRHAKQDEAGIKDSADFVDSLIETEKSNGISENRIIIAGFSQGSVIALYTGLRASNPLAGIIALSGYLPLHKQLEHSHRTDVPIFLAHGEQDDILPIEYGRSSHEQLEKWQVPVSFHTYRMAHSVSDEEIRDLKRWLHEKLL